MSIITPQKMVENILKTMDEIALEYPKEDREQLKTVMLGQLGMAMFNRPVEKEKNTTSKRKIKQELTVIYTEAANMLRVHEKIWQEEWEAAPNPFVAIKTWNHENNVERRLAVINPYMKARDKLNYAKDNA